MPDKISDLIDAFVENDEPIIDLTDPKTFTVAALIAVLFGFMIGAGYHIVFTSVDCSTAIKTICLPNEYQNHKLEIVIVTLAAGVLTGAGPYIFKWIASMTKDCEDGDE